MIQIFKRKVWEKDPSYPGGYAPHNGMRTNVKVVDDEEEARRICKESNQHVPKSGTAGYYNFLWTEYTAI